MRNDFDDYFRLTIPLHNPQRVTFKNPSQLDQLLKTFPLDEEFINWAYSQGYRVVYNPKMTAGNGRVILGFNGTITIGIDGPVSEIDIALAHELVHIAVPDIRLGLWNYTLGSLEKKTLHTKYEEVIDNHARAYAKDLLFMGHVKKTFGDPQLYQQLVT